MPAYAKPLGSTYIVCNSLYSMLYTTLCMSQQYINQIRTMKGKPSYVQCTAHTVLFWQCPLSKYFYIQENV